MPHLNRLSIQHFRNLNNLCCELSPRFNLFFGENGAGKTSILEAIYYLGLGKSFRTSQFNRIIQQNAQQFMLVANLTDSSQHILGVERKITGEHTLKLDGEKQKSIATITKLLPIQFMSPMSYRFFHDGPKIRRQFLDWALFHVEPSYLTIWKQLQRILKQRNSALKLKQSVSVWDSEFVRLAKQIDQLRRHIFNLLLPICKQQLQQLLPNFEFNFEYKRGWPDGVELQDLLIEQAMRDRQLGYTYFGPQRADFQLIYADIAVQDILSQGQQKLAAYALHLSQGILLHQQKQTSPIYLIDDLPSELDSSNRLKIIQLLENLQAQVCITGISEHDLICYSSSNGARMFHVEQGKLSLYTGTSSPTEKQTFSIS